MDSLKLTQEEIKELSLSNPNINTFNDQPFKVNSKLLHRGNEIMVNKLFNLEKRKSILNLTKSMDKLKMKEIERMSPYHRLNSNYIEKLSYLLHNSKNNSPYFQTRKNIDKSIIRYDNKIQNMIMTLPKNEKKGRSLDKINDHIKATSIDSIDNEKGKNDFLRSRKLHHSNNFVDYKIDHNLYDKYEESYYNDSNNPLHKLLSSSVRKILFKNKEPLETEPNNEKYPKKIYDKLRTKYTEIENIKFPSQNDIFSKNSDSKTISEFNNQRNFRPKYKIIATSSQIKEFDENLGKSIQKGNLLKLTEKQKENLGYIAELNVFSSLDKIKEKSTILNKIKKPKSDSRYKLTDMDLFHYNKEKWKKIALESQKKEDHEEILNLNKKNFDCMEKMRSGIEKMKKAANQEEKEVTKILYKNDVFLKNLGIMILHTTRRKVAAINAKKVNKKDDNNNNNIESNDMEQMSL